MMTQAEFEAMLDGQATVATVEKALAQSKATGSMTWASTPEEIKQAAERKQRATLDALIVELQDLARKGMFAVMSDTMRQYFDTLDDLAFEVKARKQIEAAVLPLMSAQQPVAAPAKPHPAILPPIEVITRRDESAFVNIEDSDVIARTMRGQLAAGKRRRFCMAGNAIVTVRSKATGTRYTYKIVEIDAEKLKPGEMPIWFVSLLNGADNTGDYQYIGTIFPDGFRVTRKSRLAASAPSVVAFSWFSKHWEDTRVEVWHEGRCGRCGRTLTVPESIESGLGPICAGK